MTSRSLSHIFRLQDRNIGWATGTGGQEKLIKSPNTNKRLVVPGHISDMTFQNDKTIILPDTDKITGSNSNWNRFYIKRIYKKDRTYQAVPEYDVNKKGIRSL